MELDTKKFWYKILLLFSIIILCTVITICILFWVPIIDITLKQSSWLFIIFYGFFNPKLFIPFIISIWLCIIVLSAFFYLVFEYKNYYLSTQFLKVLYVASFQYKKLKLIDPVKNKKTECIDISNLSGICNKRYNTNDENIDYPNIGDKLLTSKLDNTISDYLASVLFKNNNAENWIDNLKFIPFELTIKNKWKTISTNIYWDISFYTIKIIRYISIQEKLNSDSKSNMNLENDLWILSFLLSKKIVINWEKLLLNFYTCLLSFSISNRILKLDDRVANYINWEFNLNGEVSHIFNDHTEAKIYLITLSNILKKTIKQQDSYKKYMTKVFANFERMFTTDSEIAKYINVLRKEWNELQ
ncbi:hypothetical protein [Mycoplasmopsis felifaucium]|uniref:Uncharacterized protein n=1 Tax=Mycoplasmopsis felifaucium TaxID=35768 RepID=A0ABZ2RY26_9BACT